MINPKRSFERSALCGGLVWLMACFVLGARPGNLVWPGALVLLAALCLVPLALACLAPERWIVAGALPLLRWAQPSAALCLFVSLWLPRGTIAALLGVPWLLVTLLIATEGLRRLWRDLYGAWPRRCRQLGMVQLVVGGAWTVADRWGLRPLGFDPLVVILTAAHFHYAGFILPLITGWSAERRPGWLGALAAVGVSAGVPLVAIGITVTQLTANHRLETVAALLTALSASLAGWLQLAAARSRRREFVLAAISSSCLWFAMLLAALYGLRAASLPVLLSLHATANALGFAFFGLLAQSRTGPSSAMGDEGPGRTCFTAV